MATIEINPEYRTFLGELTRQFTARDVILSDYAQGLLSLSVEAWFEEPLPFREPQRFQEQELKDMARHIVERMLGDPHINVRRNRAAGRTKLFDLLPALADAGRNVVREYIDKGF
ncbi:MAG TPA: hypothetical protein VF420_06245 [Casimicrobiaceae bacterium]